jgi:hypothetical protein
MSINSSFNNLILSPIANSTNSIQDHQVRKLARALHIGYWVSRFNMFQHKSLRRSKVEMTIKLSMHIKNVDESTMITSEMGDPKLK